MVRSGRLWGWHNGSYLRGSSCCATLTGLARVVNGRPVLGYPSLPWAWITNMGLASECPAYCPSIQHLHRQTPMAVCWRDAAAMRGRTACVHRIALAHEEATEHDSIGLLDELLMPCCPADVPSSRQRSRPGAISRSLRASGSYPLPVPVS